MDQVLQIDSAPVLSQVPEAAVAHCGKNKCLEVLNGRGDLQHLVNGEGFHGYLHQMESQERQLGHFKN